MQRYATLGPRLGTAMNAANALIDQQLTADVNVGPDYGPSRLGMILKTLSEEERVELIRAGQRHPRLICVASSGRQSAIHHRTLWIACSPGSGWTMMPVSSGCGGFPRAQR